VIAQTEAKLIAAIADETKKYYGVQFHPEVTHTLEGKKILERFVLTICQCQPTWSTQSIIQESIERIREQVGKEHVILGLSGGVDSSVVAALLHQAIGDQLTCIFVDTGLLRLNEAEQVQQIFEKQLGMDLKIIEAKKRFLKALINIHEPEEKRKIIGHLFIDIFNEASKEIKNVQWLAQGTIYPDVIESAKAHSKAAHVIKSHHNVGGLPKELPFKLLEPVRELFKDEVRKVGLELGLSNEMVYRHPFRKNFR